MGSNDTPSAKCASQSPDSPADLVKRITALVAALFGGAAGALTLGPPTDVPALTTALTTAVAAIAWLLTWALAARTGRRGAGGKVQQGAWVAIAGGGLVLLLSIVGYVYVRDSRTVPYAGGRCIIGTELTEQGKQFAAETSYSPEKLLMAAVGNAEDVWTRESLHWSAVLLWSTFMFAVGACLFPVLFLWYVLTVCP